MQGLADRHAMGESEVKGYNNTTKLSTLARPLGRCTGQFPGHPALILGGGMASVAASITIRMGSWAPENII